MIVYGMIGLSVNRLVPTEHSSWRSWPAGRRTQELVLLPAGEADATRLSTPRVVNVTSYLIVDKSVRVKVECSELIGVR